VLEATTSKILITFGEYFLFSVFYFLKIHLSFPHKKKKQWYVYMSFRSNTIFLVIFQEQVLFERKPKEFDLNFWGEGGVRGQRKVDQWFF